ncbi:hypothetical protein F53441_13891 [Fusarium austroafricanum]|uniref:Uncharacterized protein n=1 Tax=Fusarium austroafricanum TaxID=2364996 RepID=A0A8H4JM22_9HYPO|nr:hypothetical protein F53441_13891 [Fusarium austroafricanum]
MLAMKKLIAENPEPTMLTRNGNPSEVPPINKPAPWTWKCRRCRRIYKFSVIRRCLSCTATTRLGLSYRSREDREEIFKEQCQTQPTHEFDWEFWPIHNDWRRFRSAYEADPREWRRRTMRDLTGLKGGDRRVQKRGVERQRRQEITEGRLERMLSATWNCEKDCDYPWQCFTERCEWTQRTPQAVVASGLEGDVRRVAGGFDDKLPLCNLLPEFEAGVTVEGELGDEVETEEDEASDEDEADDEDEAGEDEAGDEEDSGNEDEAPGAREDTPFPYGFDPEELEERRAQNRRRLWQR